MTSLALWCALAIGADPSTPEESGEIPGLPPGAPPPADQVDARAHALAAGLRCPVCQGLSVADSTSEAALIFQKRIHELVAMGYTDDQIVDYFVDRYGSWLLLEPPAQGLDWIIWLAPGLAAGLGLTWATATVFRWRREPDEVPLPSDLGVTPKDPYEARLLAELED